MFYGAAGALIAIGYCSTERQPPGLDIGVMEKQNGFCFCICGQGHRCWLLRCRLAMVYLIAVGCRATEEQSRVLGYAITKHPVRLCVDTSVDT